ncbi:MAG: cytochrome c [Bacteroidales bacterium]|nr:cytochrome c [Bacteroidales bacterium]
MKYTVPFILCLMLLPSLLRGQDWVVPEDRRGRLSTFPFTDETRKEGERLYTINCMSCHGTPGKNNYIALEPSPGDPATEKIQRNNDGEIFHKVSVGRGQMPSFRSVLTTDEIWKIVSYVRGFNRSYIQKVMPVITSAAYPGAVISMSLAYSTADRLVTVTALATDEVKSVPVTNAGVRLFASRYFGMMPVDEEKLTDINGAAAFSIPADFPGDTAGNVSFSAKFTDEEIFGVVAKDTVMKAGAVTIPVSLVAQRAMWNSVRKAPVWVILSYGIGVLAVWGFIFLVMMKLRDIYMVGSALRGKLPPSPSHERTIKPEKT